MRRNRNGWKRVLVLFLCWVLCAVDVIPTGLTVWASEVSGQNEPTVEGEMTAGQGAQDSQEECAPEENADGDNEQESSDENDGSGEGDTPEIPSEGNVGEDAPPQPEEEIEAETPEENSEEVDTGDESVVEDDAEISSPASIMSVSVPMDVIAHGEYKENGSDTVWYIEKSGKLVVEGTGEFAARKKDWVRTVPWADHQDKIKSAQIKVTGMTDASYLLHGCSELTEADLSDFDTSAVTNMESMFNGCSALETLDLSKFDTSNVTNMSCMFNECLALKNLDLSQFNTSNVRNMRYMFSACGLQELDLSSFITSQVTDMYGMFDGCSEMKQIDLSSFDTSNVTDMCEMFRGNNADVDLSGFDTSKVVDMSGMFAQNHYRTELDLSSFDTSNVRYINAMFNSSHSLEVLDLSGFDLGNVEEDISSFLPNWKNGKLKTIYTPKNLKRTVPLKYVWNGKHTSETWYMADGTKVQELPKNLDYSIVLTKNKPTSVVTASITASKKKTAYLCGDTLNVDDLTVIYHSSKGAVIPLTQGFTTNAAEITMSKPGKKMLVVSYTEPETNSVLTAEIELTVTLAMSGDSVEVTLPEAAAYIYNGRAQTPIPNVKLKNGAETLTAGTDYTVSYKNNINAGEASVVIAGMGVYSGKVEKTFTITPADVTIRVEDTTIAVGDPVPETFACEMKGFYNGDEEKVTGIVFSFTDAEGNEATVNTATTGVYTVTPSVDNVGANYAVGENGYLSGTLTIAEERVVYKVSFDMMGHGTGITPLISARSGQLIDEPERPTDADHVFEGWYKDRACTKAWNFTTDTVQENITLYARWRAQTAEGGVFIQEIPNQTYTGSAIKPVPAVFAADGTLLKSGRDYTVKYVNNTNADQVTAQGGVSGSLEADGEEQNAFNKQLPYVEIKGKGNHTGTVYRNFHIQKADIGDGKGNAAVGVTLKYTDQLVKSTTKEQNPFSSLKYKKAMKAGTDFTVALSSSDAHDADGKAVKGENGGAWSVAGTFGNNKYTFPSIPRGYNGVFEMIITGTGNYKGEIRKNVYVTDKVKLIKNVTVALGKNLKSRPYSGSAVMLTPGYYENRKYYKVDEKGEWSSSSPEADGNDLFTVKNGKKYLICGKDYIVTYADNKAVGTATMTVTGIGDYMGSKSATFKITGEAFKANTIDVKGLETSMPYTGRAVTQNKVTLATKVTKANPVSKTLDYGRHYTISYKNNVKKGTATMIFMARPESGYSGSFQKTFKIGAVSLADSASVKVEAADGTDNGQDSLTSESDEKGNTVYRLNGTVLYTREGAKPSKRIRMGLIDGAGKPTGVVLKEGTDYTVSYANNTVLASAGQANKVPTMTFKGKGNYTGSLKVTFAISEAAMEEGADNLTVSAAAVAFDDRKRDNYEYAPKITVKDGRKTLGGKKDYTVDYENCSQTAVKSYLEKLEAFGLSANAADNGATGWEELRKAAPRAVIKAVAGKGYKTDSGKEITVYLNVYQTKLTANNIYVVVSNEPARITYNGQQVRPDVTIYFGDAKDVKKAKKDEMSDEATLTGSTYHLKKLAEKKAAAGDYTLTYGANVTAGKNRGSVTVIGTGMYGGNVTVKFTILNRDVYQAP